MAAPACGFAERKREAQRVIDSVERLEARRTAAAHVTLSFRLVRTISLVAQVIANARNRAQRRRNASTRTAATLTGIVTTPPPITFSTLQIPVSQVFRTSTIQPYIVVSNLPTKPTVVSGAAAGG